MNKKIIASTLTGLMLLTVASPVFAYTKEETVYSKIKTNGQAYETIVNSKLVNKEGLEKLEDVSDLLGIKNVSGDEIYNQDGEKLTWMALGKNISYQGKTEKPLPISLEISYTLDGNPISAEELKGKSGKVGIKINYINNDAHTAYINGKDVTLYTPFVVLAGTYIDMNNNSNITITKGKVIEEGNKAFVVGFAFPGLQESLDVSKDTIDIPSSIEITMNAKDFELNQIYNFASSKILQDSDLDVFDKLDNLSGKVTELKDASTQLAEGAGKLADGANTLNESTATLANGISKASDGAALMKSKVEASVSSMTVDTSDALTQEQIDGIAAQAVAKAALTDEQKAGIIAKTDASIEAIAETKIYPAADAQIEEMVATINKMAGTEIVTEQVAMGMKKKARENSLASAKQIAEMTAVSTAEETAKSTADAVARVIASQVANSVKQEAGKKVQENMTALTQGLGELSYGLDQLDTGASQFKAGTQSLADGARELSDGMNRFDKDGIQKIIDFINGDLKDIKGRVQKLKDLAEEYNNFTKKANGVKSDVKFVIVIDEIKK